MDLAFRKTYRKQLTTLINDAEDLCKQDSIEDDEIPVLIARMKAIQASLNEINEKLAPMFEVSQMEKECEKIMEYNDKAVLAITRLEQRQKQEIQVENGLFTRESRNQDNVSARTEHLLSVKLPKLNIMKFDGDIASWPAFWEQYCPAIHNNANLDDVTKFAYLKSYLTNKAAISIAGLTAGQSSYNDAIELLKDEYANTERIVDVYIQKLLSISHVKYEKDVQGLRKLYNTATTIAKSLKSLGISPEQYGLLVKSIIFKALPYNLRIAFNKQKLNDSGFNKSTPNVITNENSVAESTMDYTKQIMDLLQFIKVELDSMEQARCSNEYDNKHKSDYKSFNNNTDNKSKTKQFTAAGLFTNVKECCLFCQSKKHLTKECDGSLSINDKKDILRKRRLCFRCTKPNHNSKFCRNRDIICGKCNNRHVTSMCDPKFRLPQKYSNTVHDSLGESVNKVTGLVTNEQIDNVYLKTACAYIISTGAQEKTLIRMLIDGGSQLTFIKENLSRQLGLPVIGTHKIAIQSFGQSSSSPARLCNRVKVILKGQYNNELIEISAVEVPEICFDSLNTPSLKNPVIEGFARRHDLADIKQEKYSINGISMLIGADNYFKLVTGEVQRLTDDLTAVNSKFGWTLLGSSFVNDTYNFMVNLNIVTAFNVETVTEEINIKNFWNLETIGINVNEQLNDEFTQDFLKEKIVFKDERYEVSLPWKTNEKLDSNYSGALIRVNNLVNRLLRNKKLYEYDCAVREYIKNDCAEEVSTKSVNKKTYYMPHRPVYRDDKETTKLRVVYDASAHAPSFESLNDQLFAGTNLVPDLLKILLNFRIGSIALTADIEKAFLQISLNEKDRDSHRFLWYNEPINKNISSTSELPTLTTYRMKRVTFGVTTSPFLLASTLKKHFEEQPKQLKATADLLSRSFYVDDLVIAVSTSEEAFKIYTESKNILKSANMNLRKWHSNDLEVNTLIKKEEVSLGNELQKVLGVLWHTITDELKVDLTSILQNKINDCPTKRSVLQSVARIFDPMGMLGPYVVGAKILLQHVWKENLDWDVVLPEKLKVVWIKWYSELSILNNFYFPRIALPDRTKEVELHVFADASLQAYGAVAYIKCLSTKQCRFLISKNRVAPVNKKGKGQLTLPKLELTAALCAVRLQNYILENLMLNVNSIYMWSDSKITLYWIKREKTTIKSEVYVRNRVSDIRNLNKGEWRYCPSKENPADFVTRSVTAKLLCESQLWFEGPEWLQEEKESWPVNDIENTVEEVTNVFINTNNEEDRQTKNEPIFNFDQFSKLEKILRVTAYILRFIHNCKPNITTKMTRQLGVEELKSAEIYWIRVTQQLDFANEITALKNESEVSNRSPILTLSPFLDEDGILRLGGRLQESSLPYETRHPVLLPQKSSFTRQIIIKSHEEVKHSGVNATLNQIRKQYWILRGRQHVKSVCGKCLKCKQLKGKAGNEPFAPLPKNRMTMANPFKFTGVDFAGPLYITRDNKQTKVYIMLFTCAVIRSVHLELVPDLTVESCIRALRRFISRRGVPSVIYSDNAKTFRRTSLEIHELFRILSSESVQDLCTKHRIEWCFIVERAAWWGGFWERLVKSVKDALKLTLGRAHVNFDELQTILIEVEATVNSRPLTYIDDDPTNLLILTPSHFLIGFKDSGFSMNLKTSEIKRDEILQKWKNRERLTTKFWKRWCTDYLQQLRSVHHKLNVKSRPLKEGDVVLIHDQHLPRLQWKMGRILNLFQGRDGRVRACEVQTSNGTKLRRPIQLLFPLEVDHFPPGEDVKNAARCHLPEAER